jgi:hypothetical protein
MLVFPPLHVIMEEIGRTNMRFFRAMCREEAEGSIVNGKPYFIPGKKAKFFSMDLDWIRGRVQDGRFSKSHLKCNNSNYCIILCFDITKGEEHFIPLNKKEYLVKVRSIPMISCSAITVVE